MLNLQNFKMLKFTAVVCIICISASGTIYQMTTTASPTILQDHHKISNIYNTVWPMNGEQIQGHSVLNINSNSSETYQKRNKRFVDIVFDTLGVVTDVIGIIQEAEGNATMEEGFRDVLNSLDKSLEAFGNVQDTMDEMMQKGMDAFQALQERFDQNTDEIIDEINNVGEKVDRNAGYLRNILRTTSMTYTAVERTRVEMYAGFNNALFQARNTAIKPKLTKMSNFVSYFNNQKALISQKPREEMIAALTDDNGFLSHLRRSRTPDGDNLQSILNEIMQDQLAIPRSPNDALASAALSSMYYGVITYISMLQYLIRANIYLADHYLREPEIQNFNSQIDQMVDDFRSFRDTLIGRSGLIDQAINIMQEVSSKELNWGNSKPVVLTWSDYLNSEKANLIHNKLPIIHTAPDKLKVKFNYDQGLPTPVGSWEDGARVSYAVQYRSEDGLYSKVGQWSAPHLVDGKTNPLLTFPFHSTYTRLVFRKFDNENPQFVTTLERGGQTRWRDIDRDLYNAASGSHQSTAIAEATTLISGGANIRAVFELGRSAIHAAAENGNTLLASKLLMNDTNSSNAKDANGYTPLHIAAESGWPDFITLILDSGFDINTRTKDGSTALHLAIAKGHHEVVMALLNNSYSADLNAQNNNGAGPLHIAVRNSALYLVKTLINDKRTNVNLESKGKITPLHLSSMMDSPKITEELLAAPNIAINARSVGDLTALHHATMNRNLPALKLLAGNGWSDINAKSANGWSPLHYAVATRETQIVSELLKLGKHRCLDVNAVDVQNSTPLHYAAASAQTAIVTSLVKY